MVVATEALRETVMWPDFSPSFVAYSSMRASIELGTRNHMFVFDSFTSV